MKPPQEHIDHALAVEKTVRPHEMSRYLEYLNNKPMSKRTTDQQLRDGCILTMLFEDHRYDQHNTRR